MIISHLDLVALDKQLILDSVSQKADKPNFCTIVCKFHQLVKKTSLTLDPVMTMPKEYEIRVSNGSDRQTNNLLFVCKIEAQNKDYAKQMAALMYIQIYRPKVFEEIIILKFKSYKLEQIEKKQEYIEENKKIDKKNYNFSYMSGSIQASSYNSLKSRKFDFAELQNNHGSDTESSCNNTSFKLSNKGDILPGYDSANFLNSSGLFLRKSSKAYLHNN